MNTRKTGACKLSSKLLAVSMLYMSVSVMAADNSIYIDQAGDNSTVTITQDGSGNKVKGILINGTAGGTTDPAKFVGNAQDITIKQTGQTNVLSIGANTTQGGASNKGITINYDVSDGAGGNTAYINSNNNGQGTSVGNLIDVKQFGGSATAIVNMLGTNNQLVVDQSGGANNKIDATVNASDVVANVTQSGGGGNETTLNLTGDTGLVNITTVGATNITNVTQSASGTNGAKVTIDINGSGNTTTVSQSSAFDHEADIKIRGSSNTTSVTQTGGAVAGHYAKIDLIATSNNNNIGITQQGSVDNLANLKISGSYNNYTILQKN